MSSIVDFLARHGVSQVRAVKLAPFAALALGLVAVLAFAGFARGAWAIADYFNDKQAVEVAVTKANNVALVKARTADSITAKQADADDAVLDRKLTETIDEINHAESGAPSPAAVAHNCERLRNYGFGEADLPKQCRSGEVAGE